MCWDLARKLLEAIQKVEADLRPAST
jgi:hypothetical protein